METKPLTINLQIIDGNFVYALNEDQTNILDFSVRRGYKQQKNGFVRTKDDIKFSDEERNEFTADLVRRYNLHPQLLELVQHSLKEQMDLRPEFRNKWFVENAEEAIALATRSEVAE